MPASYLGACYPTEDQARAAHCAQGYPIDTSAGGVPVVISCEAPTLDGLQLLRQTEAGSTVMQLQTTYSPCDLTDLGNRVITSDLALQAWGYGFSGVLICYLVAFACGQVLDAIYNRYDPDS